MQKISVAIILLALSILSVACGAGGLGSVSTDLEVEMSEFSFTPTSFTIPAGKEITLELKNSGSIEHDFIILKKDAVVRGSFNYEKQKDDIYFDTLLDSDKTGTFTFTAPAEPGEYQIICGIAGHFQAGMVGKLTVVAVK